MPDIELRFSRDMLVLSAPIDATLARQGIDAALDRQYLNVMEPDAITDALRLEALAGAQCIVTTTEDITRARLAHLRMEGDPSRLAQAALAAAAEVKPQHLLAEIGPCGLPLDASSKASLNENRAQYADAARAFDGCEFDAYFLNGFTSVDDLKCALMGVAQVSGKPMMASVYIGESDSPRALEEAVPSSGAKETLDDIIDTLPFAGYEPAPVSVSPIAPSARAFLNAEAWPEAIAVMEDLGASVVGFETAEPLFRAVAYTEAAAKATYLPLLAQLRVRKPAGPTRTNSLVPVEDRKDYAPDTMEHAAVRLYAAGVQFLRATGDATPAYTGALAATVLGLDVRPRS